MKCIKNAAEIDNIDNESMHKILLLIFYSIIQPVVCLKESGFVGLGRAIFWNI
jgi:hypothetical protein